jgi:tetratricopeptide (TPR) repeat protein
VFGALGTQGEKFNAIERIGLGGYALVTYLWKAIVPVNLLCFYPYPLKQNGHLEYQYYIYPLVVLLLAAAIWFFLRKSKAMLFGLLFFIINIALLLQFIPVGGAIVADRYSYIPYLGLFFMLGWLVSDFFEDGRKLQTGKALLGGVLVYCVVLAWMSNERCKVWYDGISLWRNEIEIEPMRAPNGYNNLGFFYFTKFNATPYPAERKLYYDSAYYLLNKAIELQATFVNPYISLGELLRSNNQFDEAMACYNKALKLDSSEMAASAYLGMGIVHAIRSNFDSSDYCFRKTLAMRPYNPEAHSNYANLLDMTHHVDSAIKHYGIAIEQNPDMYAPYLNRARAYQRNGRCAQAYPDFEKALALEPQLGEIYYARSQCHYILGKKMEAKQDLDKAISLGYTQIDPNYANQFR